MSKLFVTMRTLMLLPLLLVAACAEAYNFAPPFILVMTGAFVVFITDLITLMITYFRTGGR